jgi:hypothetical protein
LPPAISTPVSAPVTPIPSSSARPNGEPEVTDLSLG